MAGGPSSADSDAADSVPPSAAGGGAGGGGVVDGLVTREGGELNARFSCDFTPMERIALTANGNLQRIFSSYYDAPVHVHVDRCVRRKEGKAGGSCADGDAPRAGFDRGFDQGWFDDDAPPIVAEGGGATWDRVVRIEVRDRTICEAASVISVRCPKCVRLIEDGSVGLGQLFRHLNKLPTFRLLDAGRSDCGGPSDERGSEFAGGMRRTYELRCEEMTCWIREEFRRDAWDL
ncbi:hypothetical protein ACHAWF_010255 [Thalassiosira exigua]